MRARLSRTTVALAVTAPALAVAPAAWAQAARIEPGTYQIATPGGQCLTGTGEDVSLRIGKCDDTRWKVEAVEGGYVIKHAATDKCLAPSLLRIYPQRVSSRACETADDTWTIAETSKEGEQSHVRITRPDYYSSLTWLSDQEPIFLLPESPITNQQWILKKP